jgi:glycosyltransferase involved in cell wall biosynthesis
MNYLRGRADGMMKPLIVHVLEATVGGTRRHLLDLLQHIDRGRFCQSVICSTLRDRRFLNDIKWMASIGIKTYIVQMRRGISPIADAVAVLKVYAIIKRLCPHIVHAHSSKAGLIARIAAKVAGVPIIIYTPHAFALFMHNNRLMRTAIVCVERFLGLFTDALITVSRGEMEVALKERIVHPSKLILIENGVDFSRVRYSDEARLRWRNKWGIPEDALLIGCVGDFRAQKGQQYLIGAMPPILSKFNNAYLVLVGVGERERMLKELVVKLGVQSNIVFETSVRDDWSVYSAFDVYALPSLYEGMPYTPIEALACGLPVVLSDVVGNRDLFEAIASAYGDASKMVKLVQPKSCEALSQAIIQFLCDEELRSEAMREVRREIAIKLFPLERMIEKTQKLYEALLFERVVPS